MKRFISVACALALASCVSPEQNAKSCEASGYTKGTEEFDWCMIKREQSQREEGQRARMAIGGAMQSYGASVSANQSRQPLRCTSNRLGSTVNTTCY